MVFSNSKELFNNVLSNKGFDHKIKYQICKIKTVIMIVHPPPPPPSPPLDSCNVATNIGTKFLLLIDKYFLKLHKLSKVLIKIM